VRFDSPLGDLFVQLYPPTGRSGGPDLAGGSRLDQSQTTAAASVEDALVALDAVLNGGGIGQVHTIVSQLNTALAGNQPQVRDVLERLTTVLGSLSAHKDDIDRALVAVDRLSTSLSQGSRTIAAGLAALGPAAASLAADNGDLTTLLTKVNDLATVATDVANQSGQATVNDIKALVPVANQLTGVAGQLGTDLSDIQRFGNLTPKVAPGNYFQVSENATAVLPSPATTGAQAQAYPWLTALNSGAAAATTSNAASVSSLLGVALP
jgi:phospholipid/cholesterol/gamma-HCH transport system substrate-binding protein